MRRRERFAWIVFTVCAALAFAALGWMTSAFLKAEQAEAAARAETERQSNLRLALWRMDSWLGPLVAREASRPLAQYQAFTGEEQAYTRVLATLEPGAVLTPSPLMVFQSEFVPLHFQLDPEGGWSSPQVPQDSQLDLAQASLNLGPRIEVARDRLQRLAAKTSWEELMQRLGHSESQLLAQTDTEWLEQCRETPVLEPALQAEEIARNTAELSQRSRQSWNAFQNRSYQSPIQEEADGREEAVIGPLVPVWLGEDGETPELLFVRRVELAPGAVLQGFAGDWPALEAGLLAEVQDLVPEARLVPRHEGPVEDPSGLLLATLPASLVVPPLAPTISLASAFRWNLLLPWIGTCLALAAVGFTLRATQAAGERRSRFASSVTHELRTPLTTFRMYSEMLARGMVPEGKHALYLETLERESARLADLVESVLAYSRLEEGRTSSRRRSVTAGEVIESCRVILEQRVREAGGAWTVDMGDCGAVELETDPEAVGRILLNLVDNACKYGMAEGRREVRLELEVNANRLQLRVVDRGLGIPPPLRRRLFQAFERGVGVGTKGEETPSGLGLGLALARALARDLGGELELESRAQGGASFRLDLPVRLEQGSPLGRPSAGS